MNIGNPQKLIGTQGEGLLDLMAACKRERIRKVKDGVSCNRCLSPIVDQSDLVVYRGGGGTDRHYHTECESY